MALTWDVTNIVDHERVTTAPFTREGRKQWHPATEALVWLSVHCGYSRVSTAAQLRRGCVTVPTARQPRETHMTPLYRITDHEDTRYAMPLSLPHEPPAAYSEDHEAWYNEMSVGHAQGGVAYSFWELASCRYDQRNTSDEELCLIIHQLAMLEQIGGC